LSLADGPGRRSSVREAKPAMKAIDIYINKLPPKPALTPAREACHQRGANDMQKDTPDPGGGPSANLIAILKTIVLLALIAACVFGDLSGAVMALILRHLP
jgi:hypothetical protein